jgi:hypothetical protein
MTQRIFKNHLLQLSWYSRLLSNSKPPHKISIHKNRYIPFFTPRGINSFFKLFSFFLRYLKIVTVRKLWSYDGYLSTTLKTKKSCNPVIIKLMITTRASDNIVLFVTDLAQNKTFNVRFLKHFG